jgi:peptidoglycan biosynthesis protein MviN/MurJ (putative lipid II flippase)
MSFSLRSLTWSGRTVHDYVNGPVIASLRPVLAAMVSSSCALSGYSLLTGIGLLLGFLRELTVAFTFGLSPQLDVFVAVMSVQLFFGAQVGNALETALIGHSAKEGGPGTVVRSVRPALYGLLIVNVGVVVCLWLGAGPLVRTAFPRFDAEQQALAVHTLHALLAPIVFASAAGLLRGALAVLGTFAPGFLAGSIVSICSILSVLLLSSHLGIDALTLGVAAGNLCVLALFAGQLARLAPPGLNEPSPAGNSGRFLLWGAAASVLVGELVYAAIAVTERSLASWLPPGSISGFFYAGTIVSVPLSLFFVPLATMTFPSMVAAFGRDVRTGLAQLRTHGYLLLTASLGVVAVLVVFAQPLVELVFVRGRFSVDHARFTASILSIMIFALPFMSLGRLIRNACYSLSDYRTPVAGLSTQLIALAGLGVLLMPRYGAQGLAMATVAGEAATALTMMVFLMRRVRGRGR